MTDQALDSMLRRVLLDADCQQYGDAIDELPECDFSSAFEKKMQKLIRRANHPIRYRVAQVAACLLLAALLSGCTVLAVSPEARAAFVGWIRETYESWFVYRYTGEEQPIPGDAVYAPTWVPEGYEEIVTPQVGTYVRSQYENDSSELLTVSYLKGTEKSSLNVEWEGAIVQESSVGNLPADLYLNPNDGPSILVWTDYERDVAFWITAPLSEGELVKVAESIQQSESMPRRYRVTWLPLEYGGYYLESENEEAGSGEIVYGNDQGFSITFGYSNDDAQAPRPGTSGGKVVFVDGRAAELYPSGPKGGDSVLVWPAAEGKSTLWVCAPLPEEELIQIAENVIVQLNRFADLIDIETADEGETPLLEAVEQALTETYVAQVEECAKRDAETGNYMSEEYDQLQSDQTARYISPEREEALARVSALTDALRKEGRSGENIVSLFGPFYTAAICVSDDVDYALLAEYGMLDTLEYYFDTTANIVDERGVLIATYQIHYLSGRGETITVSTAEEMQFMYESNQIYLKAYRAAQAETTQE